MRHHLLAAPSLFGTLFRPFDVSPSQRDLVYDYIINRFGQEKTAFILAIGTIKSKGCIDEICRALSLKWNREHQRDEKEFRKVMEQLKDDGASITFGDVGDGFGLYLIDESGTLFRPFDVPCSTLEKAESLFYRKDLSRLRGRSWSSNFLKSTLN